MTEHAAPALAALLRRATSAAACVAVVDPAQRDALAGLLLTHRSAGVDGDAAFRLAQAIARASQGGGHLWQDLGLDGRQQVSALMEYYFAPLFVRNTRNLKWKRFLYLELGAAQGQADLRPPKCGACDDFHHCYPDSPAPLTFIPRNHPP